MRKNYSHEILIDLGNIIIKYYYSQIISIYFQIEKVYPFFQKILLRRSFINLLINFIYLLILLFDFIIFLIVLDSITWNINNHYKELIIVVLKFKLNPNLKRAGQNRKKSNIL